MDAASRFRQVRYRTEQVRSILKAIAIIIINAAPPRIPPHSEGRSKVKVRMPVAPTTISNTLDSVVRRGQKV